MLCINMIKKGVGNFIWKKIQSHLGRKTIGILIVVLCTFIRLLVRLLSTIKEKWCIKMYYSLPAGDLGSINHGENFSMTAIVSSANHQRPGQRIVFEDGDRPGMESTARPSALSFSPSFSLVFLSSPFSRGANGCGVFTLAAPVERGRPYNFRAYYHRDHHKN